MKVAPGPVLVSLAKGASPSQANFCESQKLSQFRKNSSQDSRRWQSLCKFKSALPWRGGGLRDIMTSAHRGIVTPRRLDV
jgi:hypothetical protein